MRQCFLHERSLKNEEPGELYFPVLGETKPGFFNIFFVATLPTSRLVRALPGLQANFRVGGIVGRGGFEIPMRCLFSARDVQVDAKNSSSNLASVKAHRLKLSQTTRRTV
jgi:hypothetical protein